MARKSRKAAAEKPMLRTVQYIRTAQYIRMSVEDSKNRGCSIENQKLILDEYVAQNINMKLCGVYIDNGATGTNFNRPEFRRMLEDIEHGNIDCVVVKDLSRLGRNSIDASYYIESYFPSKKVRFIAVTDNFDTENQDRTSGLVLHLKNIINEAYAYDIGKKIRTQARQAMRDGQYVSASPRYGYLKDPDDCHKLIVDAEAAGIVKQVFEWFAQGVSINEIALRLNEKNIPTPNIYKYKKGIITTKKAAGGGLWQTWTIQRMLEEPLYTGDMVQGKTRTAAKKQTPVKDKSQWIIVPSTHEAIIDKELFHKVQARIAENRSAHKEQAHEPFAENIFKGKIFCGHCGRSLHRQRAKRKKTADKYVFHCLTNTRYQRGGCENQSILEDELLNVIITSIKGQADALVDRRKLIYCRLSDKRRTDARQAEMISLQRTIERKQDFLSGLYESLVKNLITAEEYTRMKQSYLEEISGAVRQIHEIKKQQTELEQEYCRYSDLSDAAADIIKNNRLTRELVEKLVDRINVYKNKSVEVVFSFSNEFEISCEVAVND